MSNIIEDKKLLFSSSKIILNRRAGRRDAFLIEKILVSSVIDSKSEKEKVVLCFLLFTLLSSYHTHQI